MTLPRHFARIAFVGCMASLWGCSSGAVPAPVTGDSRTEATRNAPESVAKKKRRRRMPSRSQSESAAESRPAESQGPLPSAPAAPSSADDTAKPMSLPDAKKLLAKEDKRLQGLLGDGTQKMTGASACFDACRAVASMERAARTICELGGADDRDCSDAKETLRRAQRRVEEAGCSCSSVR